MLVHAAVRCGLSFGQGRAAQEPEEEAETDDRQQHGDQETEILYGHEDRSQNDLEKRPFASGAFYKCVRGEAAQCAPGS